MPQLTAQKKTHAVQPPVAQQKTHTAAEEVRPACPVISYSQSVQQIGTMNDGKTSHKLIFTAMTTRSMDWVDLHYSINTMGRPWQMNNRMRMAVSTNDAKMFEFAPIVLSQGDTLLYSFTYCTEGVDCDTEMFQYRMPPPLVSRKSHDSSTAMPPPLMSSSTMMAGPATTKSCTPTQFTHRCLKYIDQEGSSKMRLLFVAQANANIEKITAKYIICGMSRECPASLTVIPDSTWQVTREMIPKQDVREGFEMPNITLLPGQSLIYTFIYENSNNQCNTGTYRHDRTN
jgi:hypothetical protein